MMARYAQLTGIPTILCPICRSRYAPTPEQHAEMAQWDAEEQHVPLHLICPSDDCQRRYLERCLQAVIHLPLAHQEKVGITTTYARTGMVPFGMSAILLEKHIPFLPAGVDKLRKAE